jgi:hypothetical protein
VYMWWNNEDGVGVGKNLKLKMRDNLKFEN